MTHALCFSRDRCIEGSPAFGRTLVLAGRWCAAPSYDRLRDNAVLASPWDNRTSFYEAVKDADRAYERLLAHMALRLNDIHGTHFSLRSWRILVGHWLRALVEIWTDRIATITLAESHSALDSFVDPLVNHALPRAFDTRQFLWLATESDLWNDALFARLLRTTTSWTPLAVHHRAECSVYAAEYSTPQATPTRRSSALLGLLARRSSAVLWTSLLPRRAEWEAELRAGQVPGVARMALPSAPTTGPIATPPPNWLQMPDGLNLSERLLWELAQEQIPAIFLESFTDLADAVSSSALPKAPVSVMTSNAYSVDEAFKYYAATTTDVGTRLIIGQHGGGYGVGMVIDTERHETLIADDFLSWGWTKSCGRSAVVRPIGVFNKVERTFAPRRAKPSDVLLVMQNYPLRGYLLSSHPIGDQWYRYFEENVAFVQALHESLKGRVQVRLYPVDYDRDQVGLWRSHLPGVRISEPGIPFAQLEANAALVAYGYNSTGILRTLSSRTPGLIFLNPSQWETRAAAFPMLEALRNIMMLHDNPLDAAAHIHEHRHNLDAWWSDPHTVQGRSTARESLARPVPSVARAVVPYLRTRTAPRS